MKLRGLLLATAALAGACSGATSGMDGAALDALLAADARALEGSAASDGAQGAMDAASGLDASLDASAPDASAPDAVMAPEASAPDAPVVDAPTPPAPSVPACLATSATGNGGGECGGLHQAYTGRGINAGYYAFRTLRPTAQYSGDYSGAPGVLFTPGSATRGVLLQTIPAGATVGLVSQPLNYNGACNTAVCDDTSGSCASASPPLRAPVGPFYWGYAFGAGAHRLQGWIDTSPGNLQYVGEDPAHDCVLGPADADFEVPTACGRATACRGSNPSCDAVNPCREGADDCGRACGGTAGGNLTPSAWRRTVDSTMAGAHACTVRTPPGPNVSCLDNGGARDFFFVYPFGAYLYWAPNSTVRAWIHNGDRVQVYYHARDSQNVLWDYLEVLASGAPALTPASDGSGAPASCTSGSPSTCAPCRAGGTCGWVQDWALH